ncbi:MAG: hypothetical protein ABJ013_09385 [Halioglobus sp.]
MNMNWKLMKCLQAAAAAALLVLVAGCTSSTSGSGATQLPAGSLTIRENQMLRISANGGGEGTLIFRGWQYKFEVENMILGAIGPGTLELDGEVWNLENVEDFAGTYQPVKQEFEGGKGLSGVWMANEKGVQVQIRTVGQDISVRADSAGAVVTLK